MKPILHWKKSKAEAQTVTSLIPALSCRSCRQNAPFAELVRLSRTSIADEIREEHRGQRTDAKDQIVKTTSKASGAL